jgi:hypothetical protein
MVLDTPTPAVDIEGRLEQLFRDFEAQGAPGATGTTTWLLRLSGEGAGDHLLTLGPDGAAWQHGCSGDADVTITMETSDLVAIIDGQIDARLAVASERIEVGGNLDTARRMLAFIVPELAEA